MQLYFCIVCTTISTFSKYIVATSFVHVLCQMLKSCRNNVFNNVPTIIKKCSLIKTLFLHCFYIVSIHYLYIVVTLLVHYLCQMLKSCRNNVFNNVPTMFKQCSLIKTLFLHCFYIFTIHCFYINVTLFICTFFVTNVEVLQSETMY